MKQSQEFRIFVASPSDMALERGKVDLVVGAIKPTAEHFAISLQVVDWSFVAPDMGRAEKVILEQLKPSSWDMFIGVLWHRFGTPTAGHHRGTNESYASGTEEEFKTAYALWKRYKKPRIMMYRCTRAYPSDAVDPDQLKRVKSFFANFDAMTGEHPGLYQTFESTDNFQELLFRNLQEVVLDFGRRSGRSLPKPPIAQSVGSSTPNNLPRQSSCFGREKEIAKALRALGPKDRSWGILLDGIGGIGKTTVAIETAYRARAQHLFESFVFVSAKQRILDPDGVHEIDAKAKTLEEFLNETAHILRQPGIAKLEGHKKRNGLLEELRRRPTLLIYDNLETLAKSEQLELSEFLRELPAGSKAIVTSRKRGGDGSVWIRLERLEFEAARAIIAEEMARDPQLSIKLRKVSTARWEELYDATAGSPLALVYVLGLMRVRSTLTFEGAMMLLRGNRNPDLHNFIFQEARRELSRNDEAILSTLSFFVGPATTEACVEISNLSVTTVETILDRLCRSALVDALIGEERYALHPLTRSFIRSELLSDEEIYSHAAIAFARYWLRFAQRFGGSNKDSYKTYPILETEWSNLQSATELLWQIFSHEKRLVKDDVLRLYCEFERSLGQFLSFSGHWDERLAINLRIYEAMEHLNKWGTAAGAAYHVAWIYNARGRLEEASRWANRSLEAGIRGGTRLDRATGMRMLAVVTERSGDHRRAENLLRAAFNILRNSRSDDVPKVLAELGTIQQRGGNYEAAQHSFAKALALAKQAEAKEQEASYACSLAFIMLNRKRLAEARQLIETSLPLSREVGRRDLIATSQFALAKLNDAEGFPQLALPLAVDAVSIFERLGDARCNDAKKYVEYLNAKISKATRS